METDEIEVAIYHPAALDGDWPPGRFPLIVFSHGNTQEFLRYSALFEFLTRSGFIVADLGTSPTSGSIIRANDILCATRYFAFEWPERNERWSCQLVYAGHSTGGEGAVLAAQARSLSPIPGDPSTLLAVVALAPAANETQLVLGDQIPPFLTIQGATDGDTTADAVRLYDRVLPEPASSSVDPAKAIVWAYDVAHNDFGGFGEPTPKGAAIGGAYGEAWLRWHVYGAASPSRDFFAGPDGVFPPEVGDPSFWNTLPMNPGGEPRIFRGFIVEGVDRTVVDDLEAGGMFTPEPRTLDFTVASAGMLADRTPHETTAVRVTWAPGTEGGLRWDLGDLATELPQYSHLSLRIGQALEVVDDTACTIASDDPVGFRIEFDMGPSGVVSLTTDDLPAEIPAQDHRLVPVLFGDLVCVTSNFLRTVRVPLSLACAQGVVLNQVESIAIVFDQTPSGSVILDTLELTRSPDDDGDACS